MIRRPPRSTLFPYPPLSRSRAGRGGRTRSEPRARLGRVSGAVQREAVEPGACRQPEAADALLGFHVGGELRLRMVAEDVARDAGARTLGAGDHDAVVVGRVQRAA